MYLRIRACNRSSGRCSMFTRAARDCDTWGGIHDFFSFLAIVNYHFIFITFKHNIFELKYEKLLHFLHECLNSTGKLTW
jgi:hypothetical protein